MEHHGGELNDQNQRKEEHKHQTDRLQLQILLRDVDLREIYDCAVKLEVTWILICKAMFN